MGHNTELFSCRKNSIEIRCYEDLETFTTDCVDLGAKFNSETTDNTKRKQ
jgi:hypothetical protein